MIRLLSLLYLLLLVGCHPPKEQAKEAAPKPAPITEMAGTIVLSSTGVSPRVLPVCKKRGERRFASNSTSRILCWSESKQIFTEPYVLLEQ